MYHFSPAAMIRAPQFELNTVQDVYYLLGCICNVYYME